MKKKILISNKDVVGGKCRGAVIGWRRHPTAAYP